MRTARIAAPDLRRQPVQALIFRSVFATTDMDVRASLVIPAVAGTSGYAAGELQEFSIGNENVPVGQGDMHEKKTAAVES